MISREKAMTAFDETDYLLQCARDEMRKAKEALKRGEQMVSVYAHRERAVLYKAHALLKRDRDFPTHSPLRIGSH
jgi:hypothetical protein